MWRLAAALAVLAGVGVVVTVVADPGAEPTTPAPTVRPQPPKPGPEPELAHGEYLAARLAARTAVRRRPAGHAPVLARLSRKTEFGSPRVLHVKERRGPWLGVVAPQLGNGRVGWVNEDDAKLYRVDIALEVDLSARRVLIRRDGRMAASFRVGIGRAGSPTPVGRYGVTDKIRMRPGSPYGCCAVALSAKQKHGLSGWTGGDRIAIHGTSVLSDLGSAVSLGCLRARDEDVRSLMRRVPLGAPVFIKA
jgi:lipoprotein-anchoring transpeptidase ErfK/SrfK